MNNRQNNRRRGRTPNPRQTGGGRGADPQNRIDNRTRGNAVQLHEKYRNMARDAQTKGDRVEAEYWWQFADHYYRVVADQRARAEERQGGGRSQRDEWRQQAEDDGDRSPQGGRDAPDDDDGDDWRSDARGRGGQRDGRSDGQRGDGQDGGRDGARDEVRHSGRDAGSNGGRNDGREDDRSSNRPVHDRSDGADAGGSRDMASNGSGRGQSDGADPDDQPSAPPHRRAAARGGQPTEAAEADGTQPVTRPRRGRPRKDAGAADASDGRGADEGANGATGGLDSDILPPSLTASATSDAAPPKRRGRPRKVVPEEGTEAA